MVPTASYLASQGISLNINYDKKTIEKLETLDQILQELDELQRSNEEWQKNTDIP